MKSANISVSNNLVVKYVIKCLFVGKPIPLNKALLVEAIVNYLIAMEAKL